VTLTRASSLAEVAATVAGALRDAGIDAVLTGGACATVYSGGAYQSHDLDFIVRRGGTRATLDAAMAGLGMKRDGDRYVHARTPFFVEFPRGPLAIGDDLGITPVDLRIGGGRVTMLSATDACRDRLAAFYHWSDRQSLEVAVSIARRHRVSLAAMRRWSVAEGFADAFDEFARELKRHRPA
jgi:hypothetical protein